MRYWLRRLFDFVVTVAMCAWCYHAGGLMLAMCALLFGLWSYFDGFQDGTP